LVIFVALTEWCFNKQANIHNFGDWIVKNFHNLVENPNLFNPTPKKEKITKENGKLRVTCQP
jgi:hypothetical protein